MRNVLAGLAVIAALTPTVAMAADPACPKKLSPEFEATFGAPSASLGKGQTVHTPTGLTMIGQPVSYVLLVREDGDGTPITEIDYRLQGQTRPFGERYAEGLRKGFDEGFESGCGGRANVSCMVGFRTSATGDLSGAELSQGDLSIPEGAQGDALSLVEADYDLDSADPVFVVCHYQGASAP